MITTFGEILMRLGLTPGCTFIHSQQYRTVWGGAELNVACLLAQWGHQVKMLSALPQNELARAALHMLRGFCVDTTYILSTPGRVGLYFLDPGAGCRAPQVLYDREHSSFSTLSPGCIDWERVFSDTHWFHFSGISAAVSHSAAMLLTEGIKVAAEKGIFISADINYRSKLWKYGKSPDEILPPMLAHCDLIFTGIDAPYKIFGIVPSGHTTWPEKLSEPDIQSIFEQMHMLFPKAKWFGTTLRYVHNTQHHTLQGVLYDTSVLHLSSVYELPYIVDRVGTGDAFMAGLIHGFLKYNENLEKILKFAAASCVLKHYIYGDVSTANLETVENFVYNQASAINR